MAAAATGPAVSASGPGATIVPAPPERPPVGERAITLFLVAVALMPLQLEIPAFTEAVDSRFPPGDLALAGAVVLAPRLLQFRRNPLAATLPLALMLTLAYGVVVAIVYAGGVTTHAILVKLVGGLVLAVWCSATSSVTAAGGHWRVIRVWVLAMAVTAVVAYVDWVLVDFTTVIVHDIETRFGATQFDPNNAGAAYAVASILAWRTRRRLFRARWVQVGVPAILVAAFVLTLSRGAYVAMVLAVIVMVLVDWPSRRGWSVILGNGLLLVAIGLATGTVQGAWADFSGRPDNVGARQELVAGALDRFVDSGGLGIGLGTQLAEQGKVVHNTAVWLLVEMSAVGLAFYGLLVIGVAVAALRIRRFEPDLGVALLGCHVVMVVASMGIEGLYQRQWWLIIGLSTLVAARRTD